MDASFALFEGYKLQKKFKHFIFLALTL
jgi:hypothetical protein